MVTHMQATRVTFVEFTRPGEAKKAIGGRGPGHSEVTIMLIICVVTGTSRIGVC